MHEVTMSLINVSMTITAYLDSLKTANPRVKIHDSTISLLGLPSGKIETKNISLAPGESMILASTSRTLSYTGLTSFDVTKNQSTVRLTGAFGQRTKRDSGDATTEWTVSQNQDLTTLTFTGTGAAPNFGTIQAGDFATLDAPFSVLNKGDFKIVKVGVDYIQYMNPIGAGETQVGYVNIYSQGPVQKGDTLDLQSTAFAYPNRGQFVLTRVTSDFVEFSNANGVPESGITGVSAGTLNVYSNAYKWMYANVDQKVVIKLNGSSSMTNEVEPPVDGDLLASPGIMLKRGRVYQVEVENISSTNVNGFVLLAE